MKSPDGNDSDHVLTARWDGNTLVTIDERSWKNFLGKIFHEKTTTYWTLSNDDNILTQVQDNRQPGLFSGEYKIVTTLVYEKQH